MLDPRSIQRLETLATLMDTQTCHPWRGKLKVGVDLGTANIAVVVLDQDNQPVAGMTCPSSVVRDGVVVDYLNASRVVKQMKATLETRLGCELTRAATAIPPGILPGNIKVIVNVVEAAGFSVTNVIDEPVAAACALNLTDGAVVDVGGGTTGMSILEHGKVIFSADEPTGGSHMTLVLSGALGLSYADAEKMKIAGDNEEQVFGLVRPVAEKMASLVAQWLTEQQTDCLWLVGGASSFSQFADVFDAVTGVPSVSVPQPLLVTPLGIAMQVRLE